MKKLVAVLILALTATTAMAQHHGHGLRYNRHGHYYGGSWVAPLIIGGAVGYGLSRSYYADPVYVPPPVVYTPPPVVYTQPAPVVIDGRCSPWTEVQNADGTITRTRTCTQ